MCIYLDLHRAEKNNYSGAPSGDEKTLRRETLAGRSQLGFLRHGGYLKNFCLRLHRIYCVFFSFIRSKAGAWPPQCKPESWKTMQSLEIKYRLFQLFRTGLPTKGDYSNCERKAKPPCESICRNLIRTWKYGKTIQKIKKEGGEHTNAPANLTNILHQILI